MALLAAAVVLGLVCLVLPKALGAVPLTILSGSMSPTMPSGTLAIVRPVDATQARIGDVLCYQPVPDDPTLVTHRVVAVSKDASGDVSLTLQGDANGAPDERPVDPEQVQGAVLYTVPYVGWVANRLNAGAGPQYTRWAAYALIVVGSLRMLHGLVGSRQRRRPHDVRRRGPVRWVTATCRSAWNGSRPARVGYDNHPNPRRLVTEPPELLNEPPIAGPTRHGDQRTTTDDRSEPRRAGRGADT